MNQDLPDQRLEFQLDPVSGPVICECTYLKVPLQIVMFQMEAEDSCYFSPFLKG